MGASPGSRPSDGTSLPPVGFDPARIAALTRDQLDLLAMCPVDQSFVAADIPWSRPGPTGNALNRLAERGLLIRASDPEKWGRLRYIAAPHAVASAIEARRVATKCDAKHESAIGEAETPTTEGGGMRNDRA